MPADGGSGMRWPGSWKGLPIMQKIRNWPVLAAVLITGTFYLYFIRYLPFSYGILLVLPLVLVNWLVFFLLSTGIRKRLSLTRRLWPEALLAVLLSILLVSVDPQFRSMTLLPVFILFPVWILFEAYEKRQGLLYSGLSAVVIFSVILFSFQFLAYGSGRYVMGHYQKRRQGLAEQLVQWENRKDRLYVLRREGKDALELDLPEDLFIHKPQASNVLNDLYINPVPGRELLRISASRDDPSVFPVAILYELPPQTGMDPSAFVGEFNQFLAYMEKNSLLVHPEYGGRENLAPPVFTIPWDGVFWSYKDRATSRQVRMELFFSKEINKTTGARGKEMQGMQKNQMRLALLLIDPPVAGFPLNPDLLSLVSHIRFPEQK